MASKRHAAEAYHPPALDMTSTKQLSKEELLAAQELIDASGANAVLKERASTRSNAIQASKIEGKEPKKELSPEQQEKLLAILKARFDKHMYRHENITWEQVATRLANAAPEKLWGLNEMERTGGEPDVVGRDEKTGELRFEDRSADSPKGRRNLSYDKAGEDRAKNFGENPKGNAIDLLAAMGVQILNKSEYKNASELEFENGIKMDERSWSWVDTPLDIREKGFALFGARSRTIVYFDPNVARDSGDYGGVRGSLRV